jgi:hypothetical protein
MFEGASFDELDYVKFCGKSGEFEIRLSQII